MNVGDFRLLPFWNRRVAESNSATMGCSVCGRLDNAARRLCLAGIYCSQGDKPMSVASLGAE